MRGIDKLLLLQETDSSIDHSEARKVVLESGEEVQAVRAGADEAERTLGDLQLALDATSREQRRLEAEADSMRQKGEAEEKRMYDGSVHNAKELEALQAEIKNVTERRGRTEDELLERMMEIEELEGRIVEAEAVLSGAREAFVAAEGAAVEELDAVVRSLAGETAGRAALAAEVDEELLELYDDMRRQKKGLGAAALVDGVCHGCHEKLSPLELEKLKKAEDPKRCDYCRRILIIA